MSKLEDKIKHQEENLHNVEEALSKSEAFIEKNQRNLLIGLGIVVGLVLIVMGFNKYVSEPKEIQAQKELFLGERYFEVDSFKVALNGDGSSFLGFINFIDEYGSTKSGNLAKYYAGISYKNLGDYQNALKYLNKFDTKGQLLAPVAEGAKGDCYVELGDVKKGLSCYKDAVKYENDLVTPIFMAKVGRAYQMLGENEKAVETYQALKEKYPNSNEARDIDKYIELAKAKK